MDSVDSCPGLLLIKQTFKMADDLLGRSTARHVSELLGSGLHFSFTKPLIYALKCLLTRSEPMHRVKISAKACLIFCSDRTRKNGGKAEKQFHIYISKQLSKRSVDGSYLVLLNSKLKLLWWQVFTFQGLSLTSTFFWPSGSEG